MEKQKHYLLKNEIEILQDILREKFYPAEWYKIKLFEKLENLKAEWYNVKKIRKWKHKKADLEYLYNKIDMGKVIRDLRENTDAISKID